ncbi:MAG: hypothetical protein RR140_04110 [Clostridia bacterium]
MKNKKLNIYNLPYRRGYQELNFENNMVRAGKIDFKQSIVDEAVFGLTNLLLKQVKENRSLEKPEKKNENEKVNIVKNI